MLDEQNAGSTSEATTITIGSSSASGEGIIEEVEVKEEETPISLSDHKRAINDLHKFKGRWKDSESKISGLQTQIQTLESQRMQEKEDFKGLYEKTKTDLDSEIAKNNQLRDSVVYNEKYRAVFPALKKAGLRDKAENLLEMQSLSDLEVETTSEGRFIVSDVNQYVDIFKSKYPYAFENSRISNINSSGGAREVQSTDNLDANGLYKLEQECKKKGDMTQYYQAVNNYNSRRQA